eukprot:scpid88107/ scgid29110/ 
MEARNSRFGSSDPSERDKCVEDAVPTNTRRSTCTWLSALKVYKPEIDLQTCSASELALCLEGFYFDLKKKDGTLYKRASYLAARGAIQRHLSAIGRDFVLTTGKEFEKSNKILNAVLKAKKKNGDEPAVEHKDAVSETDWKTIMDHFKDVETTDNPVHLTRYVWLILSLHFCLRGREVQSQLTKSDLQFDTIDGHDIIRLSKDFTSKNHQGGITGTAFSSAGVVRDPHQVRVIKLYLSRLNPDMDRLFQRAKGGALYAAPAGNVVWFMKAPLSHNILGKMMESICEAAGVRKYTNHCIRATAISQMKACGIEDRKICAVSGHKNPASLQSYDRVTDADSVRMSTAIDTLSNSDTAESKENLPAVSEVSDPSPKEAILTDQAHPKPVAS